MKDEGYVSRARHEPPSPFFLRPSPFRSSHLEIPSPLPVRHRGIELPLFGAEEVQVVLDHVVAERLTGERARLEGGDRFVERVRDVRQLAGLVDVAFERGWWLGLLLDPVES